MRALPGASQEGWGGSGGTHAMQVRREHLVSDTVLQMRHARVCMKRPLKVVFVGEAGVDEGGVAKVPTAWAGAPPATQTGAQAAGLAVCLSGLHRCCVA